MTPAQRAWTSSLLAGVFIALAVTGLLSFATPYDPVLAGIHTILGLAVIAVFVFHLRNNLRPLGQYLRRRRRLLAGVALPALLALGVMIQLPPLANIIETGYALRRMGGVEEGSFSIITTRPGVAGLPLRVSVRAGRHYESAPQPLFLGLTYTSIPQMAFWVEDTEGRYVDTLYVTRKLTDSSFQSTDLFSDEVIRRPEALPVWSHRRGVTYADGLRVPLPDSGDLDGVTAPTPLGHYDLLSRTTAGARRIRVFMEINRSYDFNAHWHPRRFPDDPVYSGSGSSGQPSLVYMAEIDLDAPRRHWLLEPVGHGHHSGADGSLDPDLSGFDTALELVGPVIVEVAEPAPAVRVADASDGML